MKKGNCEYLYSKNIMDWNWTDNSVLLLSTALENMNSLLPVQRRQKRSGAKSAILLALSL